MFDSMGREVYTINKATLNDDDAEKQRAIML